jgi:hypothetical protein
MPAPDPEPNSGNRRAEVARLSELSRDLMRQIDVIKRRMDEITADIAARPSEIKRPDSPS